MVSTRRGKLDRGDDGRQAREKRSHFFLKTQSGAHFSADSEHVGFKSAVPTTPGRPLTSTRDRANTTSTAASRSEEETQTTSSRDHTSEARTLLVNYCGCVPHRHTRALRRPRPVNWLSQRVRARFALTCCPPRPPRPPWVTRFRPVEVRSAVASQSTWTACTGSLTRPSKNICPNLCRAVLHSRTQIGSGHCTSRQRCGRKRSFACRSFCSCLVPLRRQSGRIHLTAYTK